MPPCRCGANDWRLVEKPFLRPECGSCGYLPVMAMAGPQDDFVTSPAMYPAFLAGRGAGKSAAGIIKMWNHVHQNPGANGVIGLPTYDDIEKILLPTMKDFFGEAEGHAWEWKEKKKQLHFPNLNSRAFVLSAEEPDQGRGVNIAWFWLDEIGKSKGFQHLFFNLQPALRQFGDGYDHYSGWVTSTPQVERPWVKQVWADGVHPVTGLEIADWRNRYPIFRAKTFDNPNLPASIRETLRLEWGESRLARQELEGEFISVSGIVFPELNPDIHYRHPHPEADFVSTAYTIDFGQARPTAMYELKGDRSRRIWVTREFYKRNATEYEWLNTLGEWNAPVVYCDPAASEKDLSSWRKRWALNFRPAMSMRRWDKRVSAWRSRLTLDVNGNPGIYISPDCPNLWNELNNLAYYKKKGSDEVEEGFAPGTADHGFDSVAYGMHHFERGFIGRPKPTFTLA